MNLKQQLDYLFNPRSAAVIGASNIFGKWGFNILGRLLSCRCDRQIYAINNKDPMEILNSMLSSRWSHRNPIDPAGDFVGYHILWPMLEDENLDAIIIIGGVGMTASFAGWAGILPSMKYDANRLRRHVEESEPGSLEKTIKFMKKHKSLFPSPRWYEVPRSRGKSSGS